MKDFWKKYNFIIILLGYGLLVYLIFLFLAMPMLVRLREKADNIQSKKLDMEVDQRKLERIGELEEEYNTVKTNKHLLDVFLDKDKEVEFIKKLENMAEETGNGISLKIDPPVDIQDYRRAKAANEKKKEGEKELVYDLNYENYLSIEINLKGDLNGLVNFINKLENSQNYVNILALSSKKAVDDEENSFSSRTGGMFGVIIQNSSEKGPNIVPQEEKKEHLETKINAVVYLKK